MSHFIAKNSNPSDLHLVGTVDVGETSISYPQVILPPYLVFQKESEVIRVQVAKVPGRTVKLVPRLSSKYHWVLSCVNSNVGTHGDQKISGRQRKNLWKE